jgi:hypothetical protein
MTQVFVFTVRRGGLILFFSYGCDVSAKYCLAAGA